MTIFSNYKNLFFIFCLGLFVQIPTDAQQQSGYVYQRYPDPPGKQFGKFKDWMGNRVNKAFHPTKDHELADLQIQAGRARYDMVEAKRRLDEFLLESNRERGQLEEEYRRKKRKADALDQRISRIQDEINPTPPPVEALEAPPSQ